MGSGWIFAVEMDMRFKSPGAKVQAETGLAKRRILWYYVWVCRWNFG
ncbi:hypothetical protein CLOSTASPAR_01394 [[Clostridium] asparagiforme DSM 15981]|uniref:Uncharacterized protein n=1 Tax=[Clostridium] asparagiforme DSM 15981 TaxID=518636 RepID=C0CWM4_9FIRM|nr:hypothetical protein CLOSTASPAR_01394 [[Clostridium] asparagiforme DSM 15981]